jgi:hypothetical protein
MAEEWDVFSLAPGGDYAQPEYLATLYNANQKSIRVELNGTGTGQFSINRTSAECTEAILAQGNLVKVRIPEIDTDYLFAFFLETGDFTLISSQEAGGEMLTFGGRGILSYLEYARAWSESYVTGGDDPEAGVWRAYNAGTGSAPGQILRRMLEEFQHADRPQSPLPLLTIDFDYTNDSTVDPWDTTDATDEFAYQVGDEGLAILLRLLETEAIRVQMAPNFLLSAYNVDTYGRDLAGDAFGTGVVRFVRGTNIAIELRREQAATRVGTHALVQGEADKYGTAVLSDAASRVTKEVFIQAFGTGTTALNAIGGVDLQSRLRVSDRIQFPIANRRTSSVVLADPVSVGSPLGLVATDGYYLPGPEGTNGDFWVGDTVRVHTGIGAFDYNETDWLVEAITISRDDDNAELIVIPELVAPTEVGTPDIPFLYLWRPAWDDTAPGGSSQIGWFCSGDPAPCNSSWVETFPTVGPLYPTTGSVHGGGGVGADLPYVGITFTGTGTVDFVSSFVAFTACGGQAIRVDILKNGVDVIATGSSNTTTSKIISITGTAVPVTAGDVWTAFFHHDGASCGIYGDGTGTDPNWPLPSGGESHNVFVITGGSLVPA